MQRIAFLVNYNLYESKRYFTEKLVEALHRQDIETKVIDVEENVVSALTGKKILDFKPDFTCSFNSILPVTNGQFLWDLLGVRHLAVLVDPALYSANLASSPFAMVSCVDLFDLELLQSSGFKSSFFWGHAVEQELIAKPQSSQELDVVFLGSCYDHETIKAEWHKELDEPSCHLLEYASEVVLGDNKTPLTAALVQGLNLFKIAPKKDDFLKLFSFLDHYTRAKDRVDLIKSIKNTPVHVFGALASDLGIEEKGWEYYLKDCKNVSVHAPVSFKESLQILKNSKVCLNSMPFFKNGTHERLFTSLACGAALVTSDTMFVNNHFRPEEGVITYQSGHWDEIEPKIQELLSNPAKRLKSVEKGQAQVKHAHTWDKRVEELIQSMSAINN